MRVTQTLGSCSRARGARLRHAPSAVRALKPELQTQIKAPSVGLQTKDAGSSSSTDDSSLPNNFLEMCQSTANTVLPGSNGSKKFLEASICRLYYFSKDQLHIFEHLVTSMKASRSALTALAAANILLTLAQASGLSGEGHAHAEDASIIITGSGLTIGDVAYWADSLMVAVLISYAIGPFERVMRSRSNQMAYCFQGLNRLALIFQQLSIGSVAVSTVTALEAAAKFPPLVVGASVVFFGVAIIRSGAMWWTITRHANNNEEVSRTLKTIRDPNASKEMGLLDRWATFLAFGYLLQYEEDKPQPSLAAAVTTTSGPTMLAVSPTTTPGTSADNATLTPVTTAMATSAMTYEFSLAEERLLRSLTEAASTAGLALGLQAFVTYMLTVADFGVGDMPDMVGNGINATNKAVMAAVLFNACASYDRALHTAGSNDVEHLMDGLGRKGLTGLFDSLAVLSYAVTIATVAGLALPWIEDNMFAKAVGDGLSHRSAEALLEVLEYTRAIMRGI